jgi:hypothetical protein
MVVVAKVVVPVTAKSPDVVEFTKLLEVAKRLELVLLVVEAFVEAKNVVVAFCATRLVVKKLVVVPLVPKKLAK